MSLPFVPIVADAFGIGAALLLALTGGGLIAWRCVARARAGGAPVLRRADSHPDAPPRPPLRAMRDLGTPFLDIRAIDGAGARPVEVVERALPRDLTQPLAAFDPAAIPAVPRAPAATLSPLYPRPRPAGYQAGGGFDLFRLLPAARQGGGEERIARPETEASIHALLDRLERGMVRHGLATGMETAAPRTYADRRRGPEARLAALRNLARRA